MLDVEDGYFELQVLEGAVGMYIRESFGELLRRCVCGKSVYRVGSGRAESFSYCVLIVPISSQNSEGEIFMGCVGEYSTDTCAACRSLKVAFVYACIRMARRL